MNKLEYCRKLIDQKVFRSLSDISRRGMGRCDAYITNLPQGISDEAMLALAKYLRGINREDLAQEILTMLMETK